MASMKLSLFAVLLGTVTSAPTKPAKLFYARGISGTYVPLSPDIASAASPATCPPSLSLKTYAYHMDVRIAPGGIVDESGTCPAKQDSEQASIALQESTDSRSRHYTAAVPKGVLNCPGDAVTPFSSLSITSVADFAIPIVKSTLKEIGVGTAFIRHMFGGLTSPALSRNVWYQKHGIARQKNVTKVLNSLSKGYEMVLSRSHNPGAEFKSLNPAAPNCSYLGGASSREELERNLSTLVPKLRPLWAKMEQSPPMVESKTHFLTDNRCKASLSGYKMETIKLNHKHPGKLVRGVYGSAISVPVSIGDTQCATLQLHRFSAVEAELSKSLTGELSGALARRILPYLINEAPAHDYGHAALNRFSKEFPDFELQLHTLRAKSALLVGRLDKSKCRDVGREEPVDIVVVKKPAAFLYCSQFADADLSLSHPCYQKTVQNQYGLHRGGAGAADTSGSTLFVVAPSGTKQCVFDSSEMTASRFREALASAFASPTPEASPELVPEESPDAVTEPVTIPPTKGKACFPAEAEVRLRNGKRISMQEVRLGDDVEVRPGEYSPVIFFSHASTEIRTLMVVLETRSARLATSFSHLVRVGKDNMKPAGHLKPDDFVWVSKMGTLVPEPITSINVYGMHGLYNPHTTAGTLLVSFDDSPGQILASSYTQAVNPSAAHAMLMPLRLIHRAFGATLGFISNLMPDTNVNPSAESREQERPTRIEVRNLSSPSADAPVESCGILKTVTADLLSIVGFLAGAFLYISGCGGILALLTGCLRSTPSTFSEDDGLPKPEQQSDSFARTTSTTPVSDSVASRAYSSRDSASDFSRSSFSQVLDAPAASVAAVRKYWATMDGRCAE